MADSIDYGVRLIDHFPGYFKETKEFVAACNAIDPELNLVLDRAWKTLDNLSALSADEQGIKRYEQWLGLDTNPYLPLEERRASIIAKLNETLPYTEIRLIRMLAAIAGWGNFIYERHGAFVKVSLCYSEDGESTGVTKDAFNAIYPIADLLERILPMNLYYKLDYDSSYNTGIKISSAYKQSVIIETPLS